MRGPISLPLSPHGAVLLLLMSGCSPWQEGGDTSELLDTGLQDDTASDAEGGGGAEFLSDEEAAGGGDDGWRPSASIELGCGWLPQVPPGDWNNTLNCGPTSLVMAEACMDGENPDADEVIDLIEWMDDHISSYGGTGYDYNGSYTNTSQMVDASEDYFGREAERFTGASLEDVYDELSEGRPVMIATYTQSANNYPSDVMGSGGGHFMLMVGMTPTHVVLHDPGRSASINAEFREYTIESFHSYWQGNAGVFFTDEVELSLEGRLTECEVEETTLYLSGEMSAESDIEKWSITIGSSSALVSGYPDSTFASFDSQINVEDYAGETAEAGLWARLESGETELLDTCYFSVDEIEEEEVEEEEEEVEEEEEEVEEEEVCDSYDHTECYDGDVYWYDSCGDRESLDESCGSSSGCDELSSSTAECVYEGIDTTSLPTDAGTTSQDLFTAVSVRVDDEDSDPEITVEWEKSDGSAFSDDKDCDVRVGSYASSGVIRESFTVSSGTSTISVSFDAWPTSSDFDSATCGAIKEFYLTCDQDSGGVTYEAHWYGADPVVIEKDCP